MRMLAFCLFVEFFKESRDFKLRVLITGAAGFIGSHLYRKLCELNIQAYGIDNFSNYYSLDYKKARVIELNLENKIGICDIANYEQINSVVHDFRPSYVINLAAQAGVRLAIDQSDLYIEANVRGFQNIIRASLNNNVKGILYASSSSVYGDASPTPYMENTFLLRPKSIYGVTKLTNEIFAEIQSRSSKLRFRGLRYFTVYGPWGRPDMAYFRISAASLGQGQFTLFGDGTTKRDFTYIDDVVDSTISLLNDLSLREESFNDVINIGGSRPLEMNYLIDLMSKSGDCPLNINKSKENVLDSRVTMADKSRLESIVGVMNFTTLECGVKNVMDWAKQDSIRPNLLNWIQSTI